MMEASETPYSTFTIETSSTVGVSMEPDSYLSNSSVTRRPEEMPDLPVLPIYITIYVTILNIIIFVVGIVGNVLVILVVSRVRDMRTSINLYLANLSVADLLVLLVCQPSAMIEFYAKDRWYLGPVFCEYQNFFASCIFEIHHKILEGQVPNISLLLFNNRDFSNNM